MKLNRFLRSRSIRTNKRILSSAASARPALIEPLEDRQMLSLTVDVRAANGSKAAQATSVGQVINLQLWATVSGSTSGVNDGLISVCGSLLSTETSQADSVGGNLLASVNTFDFGAFGASEGTQQDLNGDGNLDVGSNNNSDIAGFMNARSGGLAQDGTVVGDTQSFEIATVTYTVTNLHFGSATDINFRLRDGVPAGAFDAVWQEDGVGLNDQGGTVLIGAPVVITDPNLSPPSGIISGTVDKSVNGSTSALSGATVYLDINQDGSLDAGDISTTSAANGSYSFTGLAKGSYLIREVVPSGYTQTSPSSSPTLLTLSSNSASVTQDFVDTAVAANTASIGGTVSKVVSGSTSTFSGVTVTLDLNNQFLTSTTTGASGTYSFSGLAAGTYEISETVPSGYTQTSPSSSPTVVNLTVGQKSTSDNFTDTAVTTSGSQLTGSVIGTSGSYQNDGNTIAKAFDGNLSTFYDGATANGDWAGLNLGSEFTITQINYAPRSGWASRMVGGIFQGSNDPNFVNGVVNLATITATPVTGSETAIAITNSNAFEFVRYLSPSGSFGNVAELQFFGNASTTKTNPPLTGSVIGTSGSFQNDGNTIAKAFDGNLSTFYDGAAANGNWAGLNLGSTFTITSISYAPRSGWASRMVGGIFQGSNDPSFLTGVSTLATITATPATGVLTTVSVSNTGAFQYVRYLSPSGSFGNVAEVQFFGTASTTTHPKLTGTVIGTTGSFQNDGNTIAKAFDGNLSTFFDGPVADGDWAGLDLGTAQSISQISYAPRSGWASRMVGGIFQASNTANFSSGVVNLFTITSTPVTGALTTVAVNVTGTFRYVRYLSPAGGYGNVAEINFYG